MSDRHPYALRLRRHGGLLPNPPTAPDRRFGRRVLATAPAAQVERPERLRAHGVPGKGEEAGASPSPVEFNDGVLDPPCAGLGKRRRRKVKPPRPYQPNDQSYENLNLSDWSFDRVDAAFGDPDDVEIDRLLDDLFPATRGGVRSIRFDSDAVSVPVPEDADQIEYHFGYLDDADLPARSNAEIRERRARRAEEARIAAEEARVAAEEAADAARIVREKLDARTGKAAAHAARKQAVHARKQARVDRRAAQARAKMLASIQADERSAAQRAAKAEAVIARRRDAARLRAEAKAAARAEALEIATRNAKARAAAQRTTSPRTAAIAAESSARPKAPPPPLASQLSLPSWRSIDVQRVRWGGSDITQKVFLAQAKASLPADCVRWRIRNGGVPFAEIIASVMTGAGGGARLLLFHNACKGVAAIDVRCSRPALIAEWSRLIAAAAALLPPRRAYQSAAVLNEVANLRVDLSVSTLVECLQTLGLGLCIGSIGD